MLLLGACAETQLIIHTAKKIVGPEPGIAKSQGQYKVGKPYQVEGIWYYPAVNYKYSETGIASWYGSNFHGKKTANGEIYDMNAISAAHRTLPLPSMVRVVNLQNGRAIIVRVNDRGPFARNRIIDLSRRTAQLLGFKRLGTAPVRVEIMAAESRRLAAAAQRSIVADGAGAAAAQADRVVVETLPPPGNAPVKNIQLAAATRSPIPSRSRVDGVAPQPPEERVTIQPVRPANLFVQAGSFVQRVYAERMKRKLSAIGSATITEAVVGAYRFYRVRIGPLATIPEGDRVLDEVIAYGYPGARLIAD